MKRNKNGDLEMDWEAYKALMEDIVSGMEEYRTGITILEEMKEKAKKQLEKMKQVEANYIP